MFDKPYPEEMFAVRPEEGNGKTTQVYVSIEEGFLANSEYDFTNYTFNDVLYYGVD